MSLIPAGSFQMGSDPDVALAECQKFRNDCVRDWFTNEAPIHTVSLDAFYMDAYEVTNARYAECVKAGKCDPPSEMKSYTRSSYYDNAQYADFPVIYISWEDAKNYCVWRGGRLPTEAEWEYAARGGLDGRLYPWGDSFYEGQVNYCDKNCLSWADNSSDDGYADTAPVGSYAPNGYDLYDMAGNVWEWINDWYDAYQDSPAENPTGSMDGSYRMVRGGGWDDNGFSLHVAYRGYYIPSFQHYLVGFRCVASPGK